MSHSQARHRTSSSISSSIPPFYVHSPLLDSDSADIKGLDITQEDHTTPSKSNSTRSPHTRDSSLSTGVSGRVQASTSSGATSSFNLTSPSTPGKSNDRPPSLDLSNTRTSTDTSPRLGSLPPNPLQQRRPLAQSNPTGLETPTFLINSQGQVVDHFSPLPSRKEFTSNNNKASPRQNHINFLGALSSSQSDVTPFTESSNRSPDLNHSYNDPYPSSSSPSSRTKSSYTMQEKGVDTSLRIPLLSSESTTSHPNDSDELLPNSFNRATNITSSRIGRSDNVMVDLMITINQMMNRNPILLLIPAFFFGVVMTKIGIFGSHTNSPKDFDSGETWKESSSQNYQHHRTGHIYLHPSALDPSSVSSNIPLDLLSSRKREVRHPIHELIKNGTKLWDEKLKRQSTNLVEAVREYKRRYGKPPPKGFEKWYKFARENKVVLIDEFDQIFNDILPFYALPPSVLHNRSMHLQAEPSTFTMRIKNGKNEIIGNHATDGRAKDQAALMKRWVEFVPEVNITMSAHDGPSLMIDHGTKMKHVDAARKGLLLTKSELEEVDEDAALWGYPLACPNNSRLRRSYEGLEIGKLPTGPSFVADHLKTMDMCENPEWQYLHGFTSWPGSRPVPLKPLFSFAKTTMHSDILLTPLEQYWDHEVWDPEWEKKPNNKAVWRGTTTGVWFDRGTWWRSSQRVRLWFKSKDEIGTQRVRFDGQGSATPYGVPSIVEKEISTKSLVDRYLDFAFTGKAGQCDEDDGSCNAVRNLFDFQKPFGWNEANEYKYQLDLDGNAWSGRFHRLLSGNQAVLKSTIFPEWYSSWIQPWVHYIPIKVDYTDLFDIMAFFAGDLNGENGHDELAKKIGRQGQEYTQTHWRYADMETYLFRLALEWARCSAPDRSTMDYTGVGAK